jgi:hypothetical protein
MLPNPCWCYSYGVVEYYPYKNRVPVTMRQIVNDSALLPWLSSEENHHRNVCVTPKKENKNHYFDEESLE